MPERLDGVDLDADGYVPTVRGGGKIAYVKPIRSEQVHDLYPQAPELQPGLQLFALHALARDPDILTCNALFHNQAPPPSTL